MGTKRTPGVFVKDAHVGMLAKIEDIALPIDLADAIAVFVDTGLVRDALPPESVTPGDFPAPSAPSEPLPGNRPSARAQRTASRRVPAPS